MAWPFLFLALALLDDAPSIGTGAPDPSRLETELRAVRGTETYGATTSVTPARTLLRMDLREVPDVLLVATLIAGSTGDRDPVDVAGQLLAASGGTLGGLTRSDIIAATEGAGDVTRARLLAAEELYRRAAYRQAVLTTTITSMDQAFAILRPMAAARQTEHLVALYLDRKLGLVATRLLTIGGPDYTVFDIREILHGALESRAGAVILGHNHPSGGTEPSQQDIEATRKLKSAMDTVHIRFLDHLIVTPTAYTSLAERGFV